MGLIELTEAFLTVKQHAFSPTRAALQESVFRQVTPSNACKSVFEKG